uniref:DUF7138 domain-containing protein n=1 Tax=Physcomitrium patens TaxID=3218 RepID=A0A2K1JYF4_PHYPA|nr:hypothetical protein PHYPA_013680 [Physcomitrium patens]
MESFATPYPVVFCDGDQEHDKGVVGVHSVLSFKRFQALMSQKTGIPANQLSAVFVCRRTLKDTDKRQKLPINENTNFNIILNQHNPSREKDCHFLVSIKKSKKERKGTRKRNAEAENADDEDSNSSRGDSSPSDERPKPGCGTEEPFSPHSTLPPAYLQRSSSPPATPSPNANGQRISNSSPNGKVTMTAAEGKVERTLLRREGKGQNGFASPRAGWQNGGMLNQRVEGFCLPPAGKGESPQSSHGQNIEERRKMENKAWGAQEDAADPSRQSVRMNGHGAAQQPKHFLQGPLVDLFLQERLNDSMPHSPSVRPGFNGMTRNSIMQSNAPPMTSRSSTFSSTPMSSASPSPTRGAIGSFLPRMVTGQSNSLMLQQAQAHMSHLQQQHQHHQSVAMSPLEFSKLSGVFRSLERNAAEPPFHWCVNDTITMGFRGPSPAGPIGRPGRRPVEAAT